MEDVVLSYLLQSLVRRAAHPNCRLNPVLDFQLFSNPAAWDVCSMRRLILPATTANPRRVLPPGPSDGGIERADLSDQRWR